MEFAIAESLKIRNQQEKQFQQKRSSPQGYQQGNNPMNAFHQAFGSMPSNQQQNQQQFGFHSRPQQQYNSFQQQGNFQKQNKQSALENFFKQKGISNTPYYPPQQQAPTMQNNLADFFQKQIQTHSKPQTYQQGKVDSQPYKKHDKSNNKRDNRSSIPFNQGPSPQPKHDYHNRPYNPPIQQGKSNDYFNKNKYDSNTQRSNYKTNKYEPKNDTRFSNYSKDNKYRSDDRFSSTVKKDQISERAQKFAPKNNKKAASEQQQVNAEQDEYEEEVEGDYQQQGEGQEQYGQQGDQAYQEEEGDQQQQYQEQQGEQIQQEPSPMKKNISFAPPQPKFKSTDFNDASKSERKSGYAPLDIKTRKLLKNRQVSVKKQYAQTMCPTEQFKNREEIFGNNNRSSDDKLRLDLEQWFSFYEIDKKTMRPSFDLAIKRYARSTGTETVIRTPKTLKKTIDYILKYIVDSDKKPLETLPFIGPVDSDSIKYHDIYNFLWNRLRAMIIDITQMPQDAYYSKQCTYCLEVIARFYFLSINQRRKQKHSEHIDEKINRDRISQTLSGLMNSYKHSRSKLKVLIEKLKSQNTEITTEIVMREMQKQRIYVSPNQPQILSYALIYQKDLLRLETFYEEFKQFSYNPLIQSEQIKLAIEIIQARNSCNYDKLFNLLESERVNYLTGSCILNWIYDLRCDIMETIHNNWRSSDTLEGSGVVSFKILDKYLRFKGDKAELIEFIHHVGGTIDSKQNYLLKKGFGKLIEGYVPPYYKFEKNKLSRDIYNLEGTGLITRQELLGGVWKNTSYTDTLIDLFKNQKQIFIPKIVQKVLPERKINLVQEKVDQNPKTTPVRKQFLPQQVKQVPKPVIESRTDQERLQEEKMLYDRVRKKKQVKSLQPTVAAEFLQHVTTNQNASFIIRFKLLENMAKYSLRVGFKGLKRIILQKLLKKEAFINIKNAIINPNIWKDYVEKQYNYNTQSQQNQNYNFETQNLMSIGSLSDKRQQFKQQLITAIFNCQKGYISIYPTISYRVLFLINQSYLLNQFKTNYIKQLIMFSIGSDQDKWFDFYVQTGGKHQTQTSNKIKFWFEEEEKYIHLTVGCMSLQLEQSDKRKLKEIIEKKLFGIDLVVIPLITEPNTTKTFNFLTRQIKAADINHKKFRFLIPLINNKHQSSSTKHKKQQVQEALSCIHKYDLDASLNPLNPLTVAHYLNSIILSVENRSSLPRLVTTNLAFQLGTIFRNMEFVGLQISHQDLEYFYYELYFEECLSQLIQATRLIYSSKETFFNWKGLIQNLIKLNKRPQTVKNKKNITVNTLSKSQEQTTLYLLNALKIKLVDRNYLVNSKKKQCLLRKCLVYLSQFIQKQQLQVLKTQLQQLFQKDVSLSGNQLPKNIKAVFQNLLYVVIDQLQDSNIYMLLPYNFEFTISKQSFEEKVRNRNQKLFEETYSKPEQHPDLLLNLAANKNKRRQSEKQFSYEHDDWLQLVQKQRKVAEPETQGAI